MAGGLGHLSGANQDLNLSSIMLKENTTGIQCNPSTMIVCELYDIPQLCTLVLFLYTGGSVILMMTHT